MRTALSIGSLPGRKSKAISLTTFHDGGGASIKPLAYFRSLEDYEAFKKALDRRAVYLVLED